MQPHFKTTSVHRGTSGVSTPVNPNPENPVFSAVQVQPTGFEQRKNRSCTTWNRYHECRKRITHFVPSFLRIMRSPATLLDRARHDICLAVDVGQQLKIEQPRAEGPLENRSIRTSTTQSGHLLRRRTRVSAIHAGSFFDCAISRICYLTCV